MIGKIFITRTGYDPQLGKHVKDPYLGLPPSLGAYRPDIRRKVSEGDNIFVISGKVRDAKQFVMCGFEVVCVLAFFPPPFTFVLTNALHATLPNKRQAGVRVSYNF